MNEIRKFHKGTFLGTFENVIGTMIAADPCYDHETVANENAGVRHVKTGVWHAFANKTDEGEWGVRVASLLVIHEDYLDYSIFDLKISKKKYGIPVDSGQAGFFDAYHHLDNDVITWTPQHNYRDPWYNACCDATLGDEQAGVIPYGAVASSGYGDGYYPAYIWRDGNKAVAMEIVFIE